MHENLCEYIKEELEELDRKVEKGGKLSASELEYADMLAHLKKSLLTNEAMEDQDGGYSGRYMYDGNSRGSSYNRGGNSYNRGSSYQRGRGSNARRDSMGRYSSGGYSWDDGKDELVEQMRELAENAEDSKTQQEIERLMKKLEQM